MTDEAVEALTPHLAALADAEGFPMHRRSAEIEAAPVSRDARGAPPHRRDRRARARRPRRLRPVGRSTGVGFFDHLLTLLARHALIDLEVAATGDLQTGSHHTVEDVGITLGQALDQALGDRAGIERYGWAIVPMDECLAEAAIDLSGRPFVGRATALRTC